MSSNTEQELLKAISKLIKLIILFMVFIGILICLKIFCGFDFSSLNPNVKAAPDSTSAQISNAKILWGAPDTSTIPNTEAGKKIKYGRALIENTAFYLGPKGIIRHSSNGMNCQNCHLDAGTKIFGNNYSAVASTYPKFRERSGQTENIYKRVNDCFERSLNGTALDSLSMEMQAIKAYIVWLGQDVKKGEKPDGAGIKEVPYLDRAADPNSGKIVYNEKCMSCHNNNGEGKMNPDNITYQYPPLWGNNSYNIGAGLFRLTRFAGYVKYNMPLGASYESTQLTDEEAWDVAAFVNSQQRPTKDLKMDWPKIAAKPIDHPFGPYTDGFDEKQHKYGPFEPVAEFKKQQSRLLSVEKSLTAKN